MPTNAAGRAGKARHIMRRAALVELLFVAPALAAAPSFTPINDLQNGKYLGFSGGLYEGGANDPPSDHLAAGLAAAAKIRPLDRNGQPSPSGRVVMVSIGMSNTTQEFCSTNNPA